MKKQNELGLIVAYYLSRYDKEAYLSLGYKNFSDAVNKISSHLGIKPATLKNMRDEFDPYFENSRVGWHKRGPVASRRKILESFQYLDENSLRIIVKDILQVQDYTQSKEFISIEQSLIIKDDVVTEPNSEIYLFRGRTGKNAENYFLELYSKNQTPFRGEIVDRRDDGCGYDFEVISDEGKKLIEVKGVSNSEGGLSLTPKEWDVARSSKDKYYLVVISDLSNDPKIGYINNPVEKLSPKKSIYTTLNISWNVSWNEVKANLKNIEKDNII